VVCACVAGKPRFVVHLCKARLVRCGTPCTWRLHCHLAARLSAGVLLRALYITLHGDTARRGATTLPVLFCGVAFVHLLPFGCGSKHSTAPGCWRVPTYRAARHPGNLYYVFFCRATGFSVQTGSRDAVKNIDDAWTLPLTPATYILLLHAMFNLVLVHSFVPFCCLVLRVGGADSAGRRCNLDCSLLPFLLVPPAGWYFIFCDMLRTWDILHRYAFSVFTFFKQFLALAGLHSSLPAILADGCYPWNPPAVYRGGRACVGTAEGHRLSAGH